ncbi:hypothetical protein M5M_03220 [Simiduia agarivorans SA1 = DSM 21679]|uniref:Uncharacterized protein n=1 Tax=Simiduia agarivorans (strain DSM 21679 / JCM 13881 / BCRC 17597 / SA1) TaxID=1117647 RepID=K4KI26_SIMAS|nr:hypothetical protein M5M_03220 [Simiduia agarivorans SA1 = DSM 21679]
MRILLFAQAYHQRVSQHARNGLWFVSIAPTGRVSSALVFLGLMPAQPTREPDILIALRFVARKAQSKSLPESFESDRRF